MMSHSFLPTGFKMSARAKPPLAENVASKIGTPRWKMFLGQLDCPLEIGGVGVNLNSVREHPFGERTDLVALVKHGLQAGVHFGEQMFGVVGTTKAASGIAALEGISILKCMGVRLMLASELRQLNTESPTLSNDSGRQGEFLAFVLPLSAGNFRKTPSP